MDGRGQHTNALWNIAHHSPNSHARTSCKPPHTPDNKCHPSLQALWQGSKAKIEAQLAGDPTHTCAQPNLECTAFITEHHSASQGRHSPTSAQSTPEWCNIHDCISFQATSPSATHWQTASKASSCMHPVGWRMHRGAHTLDILAVAHAYNAPAFCSLAATL